MKNNNRLTLKTDLTSVHAIIAAQLPGDDVRLIHSLRPLAGLLAEGREFTDALPLQYQILDLCLAHPNDPDLPSIADARLALATTLKELGRFAEATVLYETLLTDFDSESVRQPLIDCLQHSGRVDEAAAMIQTMIDRHKETPTEKSFSGLVSWLTRLSGLHRNQGNFAEAARVLEETVPLMRAKHEVMAIPQLDQLAELYRQAGNTAEHDRVRALRREIADRCDY